MKNTNTAEKQETMEEKQIKDRIYDLLKGRYNCSRDWEAWQIGTMQEDDFSPLEEDYDLIEELYKISQSAVRKARTEVAEDIIEDIKNYIYKSEKQSTIDYLKAKYLSPTTEKIKK